MMKRVFIVLAMTLMGCATTPPVAEPDVTPTVATTEKPFTIESVRSGMTVLELQKILMDEAQEVEPSDGQFRLVFDGVPMAILTDETADRMRIVAPIIKTGSLSDDLRIILLEANFKSALDARYATGGEFLYGVFIHRLSTLDAKDFRSGLRQVASLVKTFGSTFSSGEFEFRN